VPTCWSTISSSVKVRARSRFPSGTESPTRFAYAKRDFATSCKNGALNTSASPCLLCPTCKRSSPRPRGGPPKRWPS
jgi:hypothetical protein